MDQLTSQGLESAVFRHAHPRSASLSHVGLIMSRSVTQMGNVSR